LPYLPPSDPVLPGHPRMEPLTHSPRLPEKHWHTLLDRGIRDLEQLLARYQEDGANFLDGEPKELLPGLHYLGDHHGLAVYCLDCPAGLLLFVAPCGGSTLDFFLTACFSAREYIDRRLWETM